MGNSIVRTPGVLLGLVVCLGLGVLLPSCGGGGGSGGGGGGGVGSLAAPIGEISGSWVVSIFTRFDGCDSDNDFTAEILVYLVIQNGNSIEFVAEDGSDLPDVVGGSIQGTLAADELDFSYTVDEPDGVREYRGTVTVGTNLRSFFTPDEIRIRWRFTHDADSELNCQGEEVWTGQRVDRVERQQSDLGIPADADVSDVLEFDSDLVIGECKVHTDISEGFAAGQRIELSSPAGTKVTLLDPEILAGLFVEFRTLDVIWSDTGARFGQLPSFPFQSGVVGLSSNADCGCELQLPVQPDPKLPQPGLLANFNGEEASGDWTLTVTDTFGTQSQLRQWGLLVNAEAVPPNIAGQWLVRMRISKDGCIEGLIGDGGNDASEEQEWILIEQNGADVTIRDGDGSTLTWVIGGSIEGTLEGTRLSIEYSRNEGDGITAYSGTLVFSDNLNGFRSIALGTPDGIEWEFTPKGASEPLCDGVDEWDGFKLDLPFDPEIIACEDDQAFFVEEKGGAFTATIGIDDDVSIGELEVLTDISTSFVKRIDSISLTGPQKTQVVLFQANDDMIDYRDGLNLIWSDRGLLFGDFPPLEGTHFAGRMEITGGQLAEFAGLSAEGDWVLEISAVGGVFGIINDWCIVVSDQPPPELPTIEECSLSTPIEYPLPDDEETVRVTDSIFVSDDLEIREVEVLTDIAITFANDIEFIDVISPEGTRVRLVTDGVLDNSADLLVTWSDDGVPYGEFPEGDTTFGGLMQTFDDDVGGLSNFRGESSSGIWNFEMSTFDAGVLNDWCLTVRESL